MPVRTRSFIIRGLFPVLNSLSANAPAEAVAAVEALTPSILFDGSEPGTGKRRFR
jgi:hypothetical protein